MKKVSNLRYIYALIFRKFKTNFSLHYREKKASI